MCQTQKKIRLNASLTISPQWLIDCMHTAPDKAGTTGFNPIGFVEPWERLAWSSRRSPLPLDVPQHSSEESQGPKRPENQVSLSKGFTNPIGYNQGAPTISCTTDVMPPFYTASYPPTTMPPLTSHTMPKHMQCLHIVTKFGPMDRNLIICTDQYSGQPSTSIQPLNSQRKHCNISPIATWNSWLQTLD